MISLHDNKKLQLFCSYHKHFRAVHIRNSDHNNPSDHPDFQFLSHLWYIFSHSLELQSSSFYGVHIHCICLFCFLPDPLYVIEDQARAIKNHRRLEPPPTVCPKNQNQPYFCGWLQPNYIFTDFVVFFEVFLLFGLNILNVNSSLQEMYWQPVTSNLGRFGEGKQNRVYKSLPL